jgi:coenzyme F420-reducing hydrogenase delta subunit
VIHLLRAFQKGADGVYCVGCLEGTCHYNEGNFRARERVEHVRKLLGEIGLEDTFLITSEGSERLTLFPREIRLLGP